MSLSAEKMLCASISAAARPRALKVDCYSVWGNSAVSRRPRQKNCAPRPTLVMVRPVFGVEEEMLCLSCRPFDALVLTPSGVPHDTIYGSEV